jgi:hypothetical protein
MNYDLSSIAVLHESRQRDVGGDVSVFRDLPTLARAVEPIDVRNAEYFAYTLQGQPLDLSVENDRIRVTRRHGGEDSSAFVRRLLEYAADHVIRARQRKRTKGSERLDPKTMSLEALVELIGFSE